MYSTCVSECFVPLMKVTPETIGQSPCARTPSSPPIPFRTVTTVAPGKRPSSDCAAASRPVAFVATIATSNGGSWSGSLVAVTRASRSLLPLTRRPSRSRASACSRRRVRTETSQTCARWPANRLPMTPAPTMQTRSTARREYRPHLTCQSTRTRRRPTGKAAKLGVGDETALLDPGALDRLQELRIGRLGDVEAELSGLDPDRVEAALLAEDDPPLGADDLGRVRLDRRRVVELRGDRSRLPREEVVARHGLPGSKRRTREALHEPGQLARPLEPEPRRDPVQRLERERDLDEVCVAGALPHPVHGPVHPGRPGLDGRHRRR